VDTDLELLDTATFAKVPIASSDSLTSKKLIKASKDGFE
jgi:hypothetical protein